MKVMERECLGIHPTVMSRGFTPGAPVFGIFGAAIAAAKNHRSRRKPDQWRDRSSA